MSTGIQCFLVFVLAFHYDVASFTQNPLHHGKSISTSAISMANDSDFLAKIANPFFGDEKKPSSTFEASAPSTVSSPFFANLVGTGAPGDSYNLAFEPSPESLITNAKTMIAADLGLQDAELLDEGFLWIGPLLEKPLNKVDYLAAGRFFAIRDAFPDLDYRAHDFRVDEQNPLTVRCTIRPIGAMRGSLRLRNEVVDANGKQWRGPPEAISMTFDVETGKVVKLCSGFVLDRFVGNTNGLCGVMAAATIAGVPPSDWEVYPATAVISRFFGRPVNQIDEASIFLAPFPETVMIQLVKGILSANLAAKDPSLLADDFTYATPTIGPISKLKFLESFAEQEFGGFEPEFSHFRVDIFDPYRVWVDVKAVGPGLEGPPQAFSFTFDNDGFCTRMTGGAVMDPSIGNTGGLTGLAGVKYALGEGDADIATRPLPIVLGRLRKTILSPLTKISADDYFLEVSSEESDASEETKESDPAAARKVLAEARARILMEEERQKALEKEKEERLQVQQRKERERLQAQQLKEQELLKARQEIERQLAQREIEAQQRIIEKAAEQEQPQIPSPPNVAPPSIKDEPIQGDTSESFTGKKGDPKTFFADVLKPPRQLKVTPSPPPQSQLRITLEPGQEKPAERKSQAANDPSTFFENAFKPLTELSSSIELNLAQVASKENLDEEERIKRQAEVARLNAKREQRKKEAEIAKETQRKKMLQQKAAFVEAQKKQLEKRKEEARQKKLDLEKRKAAADAARAKKNAEVKAAVDKSQQEDEKKRRAANDRRKETVSKGKEAVSRAFSALQAKPYPFSSKKEESKRPSIPIPRAPPKPIKREGKIPDKPRASFVMPTISNMISNSTPAASKPKLQPKPPASTPRPSLLISRASEEIGKEKAQVSKLKPKPPAAKPRSSLMIPEVQNDMQSPNEKTSKLTKQKSKGALSRQRPSFQIPNFLNDVKAPKKPSSMAPKTAPKAKTTTRPSIRINQIKEEANKPKPAPFFQLPQFGTPRKTPTPTAETTTAPRGVPTIVAWKRQANGGISGQIFGSDGFKEGERVETSAIAKGNIVNGSVVTTNSGSRYFLSPRTVREMRAEATKTTPKAKVPSQSQPRPTLQLTKLAKERDAMVARAALEKATKESNRAQTGRPTFTLGDLFGYGNTASGQAPPKKKANAPSRRKPVPSEKTSFAPTGVPTIQRWKQNRDKSITGFISGTKAFNDGERITTSPIASGIIEKKQVVVTSSGSKYFLQ